MSLIQHAELVLAPAQVLFDLTQDYARRAEWDPFPESYEFHEGETHPKVGVELTVRARNGFRMRVKYITFDRPHAAAIRMVAGPWFIHRFAGTWQFSSDTGEATRITFKYNVVAGPGIVRWLLQPILDRSFSQHTKVRLQALKSYVERKGRNGDRP